MAILLLALVSSCGTRSKTTDPAEPRPCVAPLFPRAPAIEYIPECPFAAVCVTPETAVELGKWVRGVLRYYESVAACPWVEEKRIAEKTPLLGERVAPDLASPSAAAAKDTWSPVFAQQWEVISEMAKQHPEVKVDIHWIPCGEVNGFYSIEEKDIYLCTETAQYPELAVFVAAHEMGHAIAVQLLHVDDEESADEIGALALIEMGKFDDLMGAALWFLNRSLIYDSPSSYGHPSSGFRAWNLACLLVGAEDPRHRCRALYLGTKMRWDRRL